MSPTFIENDERVAILGTPGGSRIISMVLLGAMEFMQGGDAAAVVTRPRFHHQYLPDKIQFETSALSEQVQQKLQQVGYMLARKKSPYGDANSVYGNMQAVVWEQLQLRIDAASDPRGIGASQVLP